MVVRGGQLNYVRLSTEKAERAVEPLRSFLGILREDAEMDAAK